MWTSQPWNFGTDSSGKIKKTHTWNMNEFETQNIQPYIFNIERNERKTQCLRSRIGLRRSGKHKCRLLSAVFNRFWSCSAVLFMSKRFENIRSHRVRPFEFTYYTAHFSCRYLLFVEWIGHLRYGNRNGAFACSNMKMSLKLWDWDCTNKLKRNSFKFLTECCPLHSTDHSFAVIYVNCLFAFRMWGCSKWFYCVCESSLS